MDKYEYNVKLEQIKKLIKKKDYATAARIADTIDWYKVKNNQTIVMIADVYEASGRYDQSRENLKLAYDRSGLGRQIAYKLVKICIKCGALEEAEDFYDDFVSAAPKDISKYILDTLKTSDNNASKVFVCTNYPKRFSEILKEFDIDEEKIVSSLCRLIEKNSGKTYYKHPEKQEIQNPAFANIDNLLDEHTVANLLKTAQSKLSTMGYEILGTEQIIQSILDNPDNSITKILETYGISKESFDNELKNFSDRNEEYGERKIIFTPNAFRAMLVSLDAARETGSVEIRPEHIVLGILRSKKGIAYRIFDKLSNHSLNFEETILKDINSASDIPETLAILRFGKAEAANFNKKTVGTEMILLGILSQQNIGYEVLKKLGIGLKDARREV